MAIIFSSRFVKSKVCPAFVTNTEMKTCLLFTTYRFFLIIARCLFRAHSCFPCLAAQKTFFSYRNFWNKEFHFLRGKSLLYLTNGILGSMHDIFHPLEEKKTCFALARLVLAFGCLWDFFGLQKAFGLLQAKKIPQTAIRPKQTGCSKKSFLFFLMTYVGAFLSTKKLPFVSAIMDFLR